MKIEEIWKWRRGVLHKPEGGWVQNAFSLICGKLSECGPRSWWQCFGEYEALKRAKCYLEVIRIAGGFLNDHPNADKARALYFDTVEQNEAFEKDFKNPIESSIAFENLKFVLAQCLALARDSMDRLQNIRTRGGF